MAHDLVDDGRVGKEIDWSLVTPSFTRHFGEPPALEALDAFEKTKFPIFKLDYDGVYVADKGVETMYADIASEFAPLERYLVWALDTQKTAIEAGDRRKAQQYQNLINELIIEHKEVRREAISLWNDNGLGSPMSRMSVDAETPGEGKDVYVEALDEHSYLLGKRTVAEWNQWIGDFISNIDYDNLPCVTTEGNIQTADATPLMKGKKESVFTAIGRGLCCFPRR